jgi:hypothetical protein
MIKRLSTVTALLAAAALALGAVAVAHTAHHQKAANHAANHAVRHAAEATGPDTDSVESGSTTTPDNASSAATPGESSSESEPSDGPGGHEDEAGGEVDHQFEGVE